MVLLTGGIFLNRLAHARHLLNDTVHHVELSQPQTLGYVPVTLWTLKPCFITHSSSKNGLMKDQ